jgi:polysaccharide biosynthesis transport protein
MQASLSALPYFPDGASDDTNEFMQSLRPVSAVSGRHRSSRFSVLQAHSLSIHRPQLVVVPQLLPPLPIPSPQEHSPQEHSLPDHSQRRVAVAAGLAIAVTTGALTQVLGQAPVYEGSVELAVQTVTPASRYSAPIQHAQPNIAPPSLIANIPTDVLTSPRLLDPVIQQLKLPQLSYQSLVENLTLTTENGRILVHYRDASPQRVQAVLSQLTQAYMSYGQECQGSTCIGIKFVEDKIPLSQARLQKLRAEIEQLQQQYGVDNLQAHLKLLAARTAEVAKEEAQLQGKLVEAQQAYTQLQQRLALTPTDASQSPAKIPAQLLSQDSRASLLHTQFQILDHQLGKQFANLGKVDLNDIQAVQSRHQQVMAQLLQQAKSILPQYLANPAANTQNPIFQNLVNLQLLQQSILTLNSVQIMQTRQESLGLARQDLEQQRSQMISLLGQYDQLRQKLDLETNALQRHFNNLEALQKQAQPEIDFKVKAPPELMRDRLGQPAATIPNLQRTLGLGAILGVLLGVGVTAIVDRRRVQSTQPTELRNMPEFRDTSMDVPMNQARELADTRLRAQFPQAS